ncbi:MAG TPA: AAA family ATPase [Thermoanaerobaculia bacterium]|jgi:predicted AAA+ superfamily ATPase|nr:AAA family ATPase [Thermoanaerobaculia bacterium]
MDILRRFFPLPDQSFFLFGPRGTGKSTWLRHVFPDALLIDLLKPEVHRSLAARPERLAEIVAGSPQAEVVVLDEVQRVPELLSVVHSLIEEHRGRRFVLTGSSARKLRRRGVDLLAGRALNRTLHPFMAAELPSFELDRALTQGMLPLVWAAPRPTEVLDSYASLYLDQEVRLEGWARDAGSFARFLEAVTFSHGSILNATEVARECEVERRTVARYLEVLEDLLLAFHVPVFTRRAQRRTASHPKFYLFDAGVFRALRPRGPIDRDEEIEGAAFEGLVAQHFRAWIAYSKTDCKLYFWRTRKGVEVDFVLYGESGFWAVEVKNTTRVRPQDLRALRAFREDYPEAEALLVYRGTEQLRIDGIWCLPGEAFLRDLRPNQGLVPSAPAA